jgi:hypothetical protein
LSSVNPKVQSEVCNQYSISFLFCADPLIFAREWLNKHKRSLWGIAFLHFFCWLSFLFLSFIIDVARAESVAGETQPPWFHTHLSIPCDVLECVINPVLLFCEVEESTGPPAGRLKKKSIKSNVLLIVFLPHDFNLQGFLGGAMHRPKALTFKMCFSRNFKTRPLITKDG